jgi:hypothetical protein
MRPILSLVGLGCATASAANLLDFEQDAAGQPPAGFFETLTGKREQGKWLVQTEANAPSGSKVLVQTSSDPTSYRFPLCVFRSFTAGDVELNVKFKTISGKKDQAAGLVWRYQDTNSL